MEQVRAELHDGRLREALSLLNSTTVYRFTGAYRFEGQWVRSVALFDRRNPDLCVGDHVLWQESYCRITAEDGDACRIDAALQDARLMAHAARTAVQSYVGVLLKSPDGTRLGTLCHFDVIPHAADEVALADLRQLRALVALAL